MASDTSYAMLAGLYPNLPWAHETDLKPVTVTAQTPVVIVASPNAPFTSLKELIAYAKANPGEIELRLRRRRPVVVKSCAGVTCTNIAFGGPDRRRSRSHQHHCPSDQPAGAQRHY